MKYLVTGVTGGLGRGILEELAMIVPAKDIAVLVRSEDKGKVFAEQGYEVRIGDFSDRKALEQAFAGVETLMFVSGAPGQEVAREEQHRNVIEAAKAAGVAKLVYTSIAKGDRSKSVLAPDHIVTEALIKDSGLAYKILRNNWYLENDLDLIKAALAGQGFVHAGGEGLVGWALRRDYAEAAAHALVHPFQENVIYELAGKNISYADLADLVKQATGQDFEVISLSVEDYRSGLQAAGLPEEAVFIVSAIQDDIAKNQLKVDKSDLETLLGHPQTSLVEGIKELLA